MPKLLREALGCLDVCCCQKHQQAGVVRRLLLSGCRRAAEPVSASNTCHRPVLTRLSHLLGQALIRPWRLQKVTEQLNAAGIRGMTVSDVKGAGEQGGKAGARCTVLHAGAAGARVGTVQCTRCRLCL